MSGCTQRISLEGICEMSQEWLATAFGQAWGLGWGWGVRGAGDRLSTHTLLFELNFYFKHAEKHVGQ